LALDIFTFSGFDLLDKTLTAVATAGGTTLCMAGTCVRLGTLMPASWWSAPTPFRDEIAIASMLRTPSALALQPGENVTVAT
jgi:hypothetical protein